MGDTLTSIGLFMQVAVQMGTPILLGTLGGILNERAGHLNLGVEGMMLMGAVVGFTAAVASANPWVAVICAGFAGLLGALIYAVVTVSFQGNQVVTGLVLTIFGTGVSGFLGARLTAVPMPQNIISTFAAVKVPVLSEIPVIGDMLFNQSIYIYFSYVAAIFIYWYLKKTRFGLNLRCVGENPAAADASGINVSLYKYLHICAGGFLCGLGGAFISIVYLPRWQDNITAGVGWIAVALIIFATWNPLKAIFGAYFFGALRGLGFKFQSLDLSLFGHQIVIPSQIFDMVPYVMTIVVLVIITMQKKKENQAPANLGNPYYREER